MSKPEQSWISTAGEVASIGMLVLVSAGIGLAFGMWLDKKLDTSPYIALAMTLLGLAAGIYESAKILIKVTRGDD